MRVLMISLDKGLVGGNVLGDVIERHKKYGEFVDRLDIIVLSRPGFQPQELSSKVSTMPTNSRLWLLVYKRDALRIARNWFKTHKYDLVVTQDPYITGRIGAALKKEFGVKLLVHLHGDYELDIFTRKAIINADAIRVMSGGQRSKLIQKGVHKDKIRVISTPVDLKKFMDYPQTEAEEKQLKNFQKMAGDRKLILFVARKDKVKDIDTFFKAIKIVTDKKGKENVVYYIVGDYTRADAPDDIGEGLFSGGGRIESKDMPASYKVSAMLVSTSLSESFGKIFVEANACGKPVIATPTTGAKEIIQDGFNGFLIPKFRDPEKIAEKIIYLLDNPEECERMGENGRKLVQEKFSDNTAQIINYWKEIVARI